MNDPETDRLRPSKEELSRFLEKEFPQTKCRVVEVGNQTATIAHEIGEAELLPGGTVSGPVLMEVADVALYVALLGEIGIVPLAVTTGLTINFLRKPPATQQIIAVCTLLKVGRTLATGEVRLYSEGHKEPSCLRSGYLLDSTSPAFLEADFSSVGSSVPWPSSQEPVEFAHDSPSG